MNPATEDDGTRIEVPRREGKGPGAGAGIEPQDYASLPSAGGKALVSCIDYGPDLFRREDVTDLDAFLAQHRPPECAVRWINVDGLADLKVIEALARKYHIHPLAVEDVLHVPQRPKLDAFEARGEYQARLFLVVRMLRLEQGKLTAEQVSLVLGHHTVLTFQEDPGDAWDPIRQRLEAKGSRLRQQDASFLVYTLLDAVVDHCFPILERYGDRLEELEELLLESPDTEAIHEVHRIKRELLTMRHAIWPMRDVIAGMLRETNECLGETTRLYLRDVNDHVAQIIDVVEAYREIVRGLVETYMTAVSLRTNEVMKVLTIVGTIFIPLTFLAGVYGMNFHFMPELGKQWGYPAFWVISVAIAVGMVVWFRRRGWL
jgi:magnesium transporter